MRIYFLGIAGTAMGNAALLLRAMGHEVMGSDQAVYPPMSDKLAEAGIEILEGFDAERLRELKPDLAVIGNAFSRGNVEVESLLAEGDIPFASLPETLSRFALNGRPNIVVTGTHGKTTTTSLVAHLLLSANVDAGYLIGGAPIDPPQGYALGSSSAPFVIEGDEYDSAFFDKRSKFIHYRPRIAILNNLEFDHADIFRDLEDVKRTFNHFLRIVPGNGYVLANGDDPNVQSLLQVSWTQILNVGVGEHNDLRIENYRTTVEGSFFDLVWRGALWEQVAWGMTGLFNARNGAMAALATALSCGYETSPIGFSLDALNAYRGVRRRQQTHFENEALKLIEDFGHHPTAIKETLIALRERHADARIIAAFEPRSNTSRLEIMRQSMKEALSLADEVVIGFVKQSKDASVTLLSSEGLASDLLEAGTPAVSCSDNDEVLPALLNRIQKRGETSRTIVVCFSNGSFGGLVGRLSKELADA